MIPYELDLNPDGKNRMLQLSYWVFRRKDPYLKQALYQKTCFFFAISARIFLKMQENACIFLKMQENACIFMKMQENVCIFLKIQENACIS